MKLLGNTKKDFGENKDGEDVPKLESVEVVSVNYYFTQFMNNAQNY